MRIRTSRRILSRMESGVYVPREALQRVSKRAAELGVSPDEFVAQAVTYYLAYQDSLHLTHDIDEILTPADQGDLTDAAA